ncbi:MAG: hypothetical protein K1X50_09635 [Candidatus Promineofilum sp.]|nr:hypothetical protein [Promineifilum sp.]
MNQFKPGVQVVLTRDLNDQFPAGLPGFIEMTSTNPPIVCVCFLSAESDGYYHTKRLLFAGRTVDALETRDTWSQGAVDQLLQALNETDSS